jgi:uncharacterized protein involved in exopolysaccharide biosynthesis
MTATAEQASANAPTATGPEQRLALQSKHILARAKRQELEKRVALIGDMLAGKKPLVRSDELFNTGPIRALFVHRERLEQKVKELESVMLPSHPTLKRQQRELEDVKQKVIGDVEIFLTELEADVVDARAAENVHLAALNAFDQAAGSGAGPAKTGRPAIDAASLASEERLLADERVRLDQLLARRDALHVVASANNGGIRASVVSRAVANHVPVFPKKRPIVLTGMLITLTFGLIWLGLKSLFRGKIRNRRQGERRTGMNPRLASELETARAVAKSAASNVAERSSEKLVAHG